MREITVGVVAPAYVNVPLWVAQQRGFLERRGLRATERILGTTHGVTNALRDGQVDIALTAPEGSIADAVAGGPLRVVAGMIDRPPLSTIATPAHRAFDDLRAAYVVGCDGAGSVVRAAAGIDFEGTPDTWRTIFGDVELTDPPPGPALTLNGPGGSLYLVAIGAGRHRVATIDHADMFDLNDGPVTFAELRASTVRAAGTDFGMRETPDAWLSRVGNATRQAARYRAGRVLLAGDAAHVHFPAGGQGLNLGLQDATNLGWKLAAEIRGWAPPGLLDSYHTERHPVGLDVIDDSLAQCGLIANASQEGIALRDRFGAVLAAHPSLCRELAVRLSGLGIRYPAAGRAGGVRVPDLDLRGAPAPTVFGLLRAAKFVLLNLGSPGAAPASVAGHPGAGHVDVVAAEFAADHPEWTGVRSMLIRPDGHTAGTSGADDAPSASWLGSLGANVTQDG